MWKTYTLGDLITESKVETISPNPDKRIRVKLNVQGVEKRPDSTDVEGATKYYIRSTGQFIYGKQNLHKGAFGLVPEILNGFESSSDLPAFDVNDLCYPEWIYYFFKQGDLYLKLESLAKGIGSKRIQPKDLLKLKISVPSREEQQKILSEIIEFEKSIQEIIGEFNTQLELIEKAKETSISEAISGKLNDSEGITLETGKSMLEIIRFERKKYLTENKIKTDSISPIISKEEIPFTIPKNWAWARLGELIEFGSTISYGVTMPDNHTPDGVPLVRVGDLDNAKKGNLPTKSIKKEISDKFKRTILRGGEILIAVVGSTIGKIAIVPKEWAGANIARAVCRTIINQTVHPRYVEYVLKSRYIQQYFVLSSRSVGQPTLNLSVVTNALIPFASSKEQNYIVEKLDEMLNTYDELKSEIKTKLDKIHTLHRNHLGDIFQSSNIELVNMTSVEIPQEKRRLNFDFTISEVMNEQQMELTEILKEHGQLSAVKLWKLSNYADDIDGFYQELKRQIEIEKNIIESTEKGYLELHK